MRWKLAGFLSFAFLPAIVGCASYHPKPISAVKAAQDFESRRLPDGSPWNLSRLVSVAFSLHPDMEVARAQWDVAKAGILTAGGRQNPTLQFSPEFSTNPGGISPWVLGLNFDIPIETAGKRGYRTSEAKHHAEVSRFNIATTAWRVRGRVREAFLSLYVGEREVVLLEKERALQVENATLLEQRAAAQQASPFLASQAEASRAQSGLVYTDAKRQVAESRARLADAVGLPLAALDGVGFSFEGVESLPGRLSPADIQQEALTNRPDLLAALEEYAASESALQLEIAKQYPDVHLGPGYLWDQGQHKWALGFSMTLPLFNQNQGPIAEAQARRTEVSARFFDLQAHVIGEVSQAMAGYRGALIKMKEAENLLIAQKKKYRLIAEAGGAGELRRVALLSAQIELDQAALNRLNALVEAQRALGRLEDAVQKPLGPWGK